jgi:hypothetical protein
MSEAAVRDATESVSVSLDDASLYVNRELSWLAFNARVLDQVDDPSWPLLERAKFLAIFASNLDEFFMIRVAGLHDRREAELATNGPDGAPALEELAKVRVVVGELSERAQSLFGALAGESSSSSSRAFGSSATPRSAKSTKPRACSDSRASSRSRSCHSRSSSIATAATSGDARVRAPYRRTGSSARRNARPRTASAQRAGASSVSLTFRRRTSGVTGFCKNETSPSSTPCRSIASSVYPDM